MWVPLLRLWRVVSYVPLLVCRQYAFEQFTQATHGLNHLEFVYVQLVKFSTLWSEPRRAELTRHGHDIIPGYLEWRSTRAKDAALPARDDFVQPACPLPERMPTEIKIIRQKLEVERKRNMDQDNRYQAKLG